MKVINELGAIIRTYADIWLAVFIDGVEIGGYVFILETLDEVKDIYRLDNFIPIYYQVPYFTKEEKQDLLGFMRLGVFFYPVLLEVGEEKIKERDGIYEKISSALRNYKEA